MTAKKVKPVSAKNMARVREAVKSGEDYSILDIAFLTGLCRPTVERAMHFLHQEDEVHICAWGKVSECNLYKIYKFGKGKDVSRPTPLSKRQHNDLYKLRSRVRHQDAKLKAELSKPAFRHPQDVALFGEYSAAVAPNPDAFKVRRHYITIDEDELEPA
jgi:hypothetical protein